MKNINLEDFNNLIFVGEGNLNLEEAYRFYVKNNDSTFTELSNHEIVLTPGETYTFARKDNVSTHPFYINNEEGIKLSNTSGNANKERGIIGTDQLRVKISDKFELTSLSYYCTTHPSMLSSFLVSGSDSPSVYSEHNEINRSTAASSINFSDHYANAYTAEQEFLQQYPEEDGTIKITFEADNGWLNVDGTDTTATYQHIAGLSSPYATSSPAAPGANARTTLVPSDAIGQHLNGSAGGTIEYIHPDTNGTGAATRVHFSFNNIGDVVSVDEPDLARLNTNSNIDRGINITSGSDTVAGGDYDQFLEIIPSETREGGLSVYFAGTTPSGDTFDNPMTAFGFYLMGREQKRDVILEVVDVNNNTILEHLTVEPTASNSAIIEYISFAVEDGDAPIASFSLTEEFDGDERSERDIFSIDDLSLRPHQENPTIHLTTGFTTQKKVARFTMEEPVALSGQDINTVIIGTKARDKLTGTSNGEVLAGGRGKNILEGGEGPDGFFFNQPRGFGKSQADKITDFNPDDGDSILLDQEVFDLSKKIKLKSFESKKRIKKAAKRKTDFVYNKNNGSLYYNENGKQNGWGDGGLFAKLEDAPALEKDDFTVV